MMMNESSIEKYGGKMKLGLMSAILADKSFEEMIAMAAEVGYECVEIACWPKAKAERRYAGVTHIDVEELNEEKAKYVLEYCNRYGIEISALSYYANALDPDEATRAFNISHLKRVIDAAALLDVNLVGTFIGRDHKKSIEENYSEFLEVWPDIINYAENKKVKIMIENCPMWFDSDQWPGGQNLMTTPAMFRRMFKDIPSEYFGLNFDPSHFIWQHMDYIKPVYEFKDKIFQIHIKDVKVFLDKLDDVGIMASPLSYMAPKLPGLGDVNWDQFVSALYDIGFAQNACVEVEDRGFEENEERIKGSLVLSYRYIRQYII